MAPDASSHPAVAAFGSRVRKRRQDLDWSLERLGEESGLHWTYVGQVERGQRNLTLMNILKLASALEVDAGALVSGLEPDTG